MGLYESLVMNFGLCNAPATFQTFMDEQFKDLVGTGHVVVYLDDVLIFVDNEAELQSLKKPSQCFAVLGRLTWHKSNKLPNNLKIIYIIV